MYQLAHPGLRLSPKIPTTWQVVFEWLVTPRDGSECSRIYAAINAIILCSFIRQRWDARQPYPCRLAAESRKMHKLEGLFWDKTLALILEVCARNPGKEPALAFCYLFAERELLPNSFDGADEEFKTSFLKDVRHQNKLLRTLADNPFQQAHTRQFIDMAMAFASQTPKIQQRFWTPFVQARMSYTATLRAEGIGFFLAGAKGENYSLQRQGGSQKRA